MMNITDILLDREWTKTLNIIRRYYEVVNGRVILINEDTIPVKGVLVPSLNTTRFIQPEADLVNGRMLFFTTERIYCVGNDTKNNFLIGDYFEWSDVMLQCMQVKQWEDFHYYMGYFDIIPPDGMFFQEKIEPLIPPEVM